PHAGAHQRALAGLQTRVLGGHQVGAGVVLMRILRDHGCDNGHVHGFAHASRVMHTTPAPAQRDGLSYRERLSPSLWALISAGVVAPMATLVFVRIDAVFSLALGVAAAVAVIALLIALAPVVTVHGTTLRAGRAHIDVSLLGEPIALTG